MAGVIPLRAWALGAALLTTGCLFDVGACVYETRTLDLTGTLLAIAPPDAVDAPAARPASAALTFDETRGDQSQRTLTFRVTGVPAATIAAVELRDAAAGDEPPLAVFSVIDGGASADSYGFMVLALGPPSHDDLVRLARDGRLRLTVRRTDGTTPSLDGPLVVSRDSDWIRPRCD